MPKYSVKIKWGKETYSDVEVNTDEDPILFKAQIFALTGVQPERQKVMCKGATLKDDGWGNVKLSNGAMVLVMGSKEEDVPVEPVEKPRFVEDMNETELATALNMPGGLINLGNTCYMNATVQCLKTVPELCTALTKYNQGSDSSDSAELTSAMREVVSSTSGPLGGAARLLRCLHTAAPRFAERQPGGGTFAQQDASECWSEIVLAMQSKLMPGGSSKHKSVIHQYFGGDMDVELVCTEAEEDPTKSKEVFIMLSCFISQDVKYLQSGLKSKMQEQITKMSITLGRDAVYTKTSKISRLPAYLTVQFMRFYYKEKEAINAKILKDVKFPLELDVYDLCSTELQQKLMPMRAKFKEIEDAKVEDSLKADDKSKDSGGDNKVTKSADSSLPKVTLPFSFEDDEGSNNSGYYTLQGVLTHRGRSSSSGHYVAWVRHTPTEWVRCDDDVVTPVTEEEVLKLSGGGDWHCAYILLYGPKGLEVSKESLTSSNEGIAPP